MAQGSSTTPRKRRVWWVVVGAVAALLAAFAIFLARDGFAIELDAAGPWLERKIAEAVDPLRVQRGRVSVRWGGLRTPIVARADDWALLRADGGPFIELPRVEIAIDQRALARREIQPLWAIVERPRLLLERDETGAIVPSFEARTTGADSREGADPAAMLDGWLASPPTGPLGSVEWARLEGATIELVDRALDVVWAVGALDVEASRRHGSKAVLRGELAARNGTAEIALPFTGAVDLAARSLGLDLELRAVDAKRLAALTPALASLAETDLSLDGSARIALDADGLTADPIELTVVRDEGESGAIVGRSSIEASGRAALAFDSDRFTLHVSAPRLDPGSFASIDPVFARVAAVVPSVETTLVLDATPRGTTAELTLRVPGEASPFSTVDAKLVAPPAPAAREVSIELRSLRPWRLAPIHPSLASLGEVTTLIDGEIHGTVASETDALALELRLTGGAGTIRIEGVPAEPLAIDTVEMSGEIGGVPASPRLERAALQLAAAATTLTAETHRDGDGRYRIEAKLSTDRIERSDLDRLWPEDLAADARAQVERRFGSGALNEVAMAASVEVDLAAKPPARLGSLLGSAELDRIAINALEPQPPIELEGRVELLDLDTVAATVTRARLRDLELGPGTVRFTGLRGRPALDVETRWKGPLASIVGLLAEEPLTLIEDPEPFAGLAGSGSGELELALDLGAGERAPPRVSARGRTADLAWKESPIGPAVTKGRLELTYAEPSIAIEGDVLLATSPVRLSLQHRFDDGEPRDTLRVTARLDRETAIELGLPNSERFGGSVGIEGDYMRRVDGAAELRADVDLTPARIAMAEAGLLKPAGEAASARVEASLGAGGRLSVSSLLIEGKELAANGKLEAGTGPFRLESASFDRLKLGQSELAGTLHRREDGGWSATIDAMRLDLRGFLEEDTAEDDDVVQASVTDAGPAEAAPDQSEQRGAPFDFDVEVGSVLLLNRVATQHFEANGAWNGERFDHLSVRGAFDDLTKLTIEYRRRGSSAQALDFRASDLGNLVKALTSRSEISGGALHLSGGSTTGNDVVAGRGELTDFTLVKMPVFARILRLGTLNNLVGMFESEGLEFTSATADLSWDGRTLDVAMGRAIGRGIVLTGAGRFDLTDGTVDFEGTVAPMGAAQRIVGKIPLVNRLVLGRDRAGVVATRFHLTGSIVDPQIAVQPLSALTPGFVRDLFGPREKKKRR